MLLSETGIAWLFKRIEIGSSTLVVVELIFTRLLVSPLVIWESGA